MSETFASDLADLQSSVERLTTVDASAITLLQGLNAQLSAALAAAANAGATEAQLAQLTALRNTIDSNTTALANAVTSNTPASAPPPPPPAPTTADFPATGAAPDTLSGSSATDTLSGSSADDVVSGTTAKSK